MCCSGYCLGTLQAAMALLLLLLTDIVLLKALRIPLKKIKPTAKAKYNMIALVWKNKRQFNCIDNGCIVSVGREFYI